MGHQEFYTTLAQVYPVLLLALLWDSRYLDGLREQERRSRAEDPVHGVHFWTKGRVRVYTIVLAFLLVCGLGACVLGLAGLFGDSAVLRGLLAGTLVLALVTLLVRVYAEVVRATRASP
ncbi:hypothetical protein [Actinomadura rayongensis]|uniref:Uncharacterized protein n=1 Tax=Actinomadura rayongensis TaxID=1429076 RepID=A0A6I4WCI9_9ACTN|nr:hypothetical protein [Actinomadura rayongensis]MXQ64462.1 hypothetical protein [Actinomadura rayongensis]